MRPRSIARALVGLVAGVAGVTSGWDAGAHAQAPPATTPPTTEAPPVEDSGGGITGATGEQAPITLPLVPVPVGCDAPPLPHIVFVGTVVTKDFRTVRFEIERVRAGQPQPFASGGRIDVRYGLDAQYLHEGERYLVSAPVEPTLGFLVSRVTDPVEDFGGDEVIGVSESDVTCPKFEDPMRTLHIDGTPIEAGLLDPLTGSRTEILAALLVPLGVGAGAIFLLAMLRLSLNGIARGVADATRPRA